MGSSAGAIGGVLGGVLGAGAASGDRNQSRQAADAAIKQLMDLGAPPDTAKALVLKQYQSAGNLTPEMEQYIKTGPSAVAGITEDPKLKEQQMSALNLLSQRASGGLNPEDRAKFADLQEEVSRDNNARQQALIQQYQQRGMGGSGAELAAALSNQQSGANQAAKAGRDVAASASQNALQAALQSGQLGSQIRGQDFSVNQARASASDEMNRFNTQNQMQQQARNVANANQAQAANLQNQQQLGNANTQMANSETSRQNQAQVDDWNNKVRLASIKSGAYQSQANDFAKRAQDTTNQMGAIGGALGQGAAALFGGPAAAAKPKTVAGGPMDNSGGMFGGETFGTPAASGGLVPGTAFMSNDSPINDTVPATLSPGEIVLPRSIMNSHNPGDVAKKFVDYVQALNKKPEYKYGDKK
jgi:hypothetical protein